MQDIGSIRPCWGGAHSDPDVSTSMPWVLCFESMVMRGTAATQVLQFGFVHEIIVCLNSIASSWVVATMD
jgi:hypothetical protein